jgi:hypothetical protein
MLNLRETINEIKSPNLVAINKLRPNPADQCASKGEACSCGLSHRTGIETQRRGSNREGGGDKFK